MKDTDRFLIGIVAAVVVLVGTVVALALLRPSQPTYQPDDTPEGVAHNYLLAIQLDKYERAYEYLLPTLPGYPDSLDAFERDIEDNRWSFGHDDDLSLAVESTNVRFDRATVVVRQTRFSRGGLFDSGQSSYTFEMTLRQQAGVWRIAESDRYWVDCWSSSRGCQ